MRSLVRNNGVNREDELLSTAQLPAASPPPNPQEFALEAEAALIQLWTDLLGVAVTRETSFYEVGGDSLFGMEMVVRAEQLGYRLSLPKVLELGVLAKIVEIAEPILGLSHSPAQLPLRVEEPKEIPLSHVQRWMWDVTEGADEFARYDAFEVSEGTSAEEFERAFEMVHRQCDALRFRVFPTEEVQRLPGGAPDARMFRREDLRHLSEADQDRFIQSSIPAMGRSLRLDEGLLQQATWFDLGARGARVLVGYQNYSVDALSMWLLGNRLAGALEVVRDGREPEPPPRTSFAAWMQGCMRYANSDNGNRDAAFWERYLQGSEGAIPHENSGRNSASSSERISCSVKLNKRVNARPLLLAALGDGLRALTGRGQTRILNITAGRTDATGLDLSQTVGALSYYYPVVVGDVGPEEIQATLDAVPHHGSSFGMLSQLSLDSDQRKRLGELGTSDLSLNFQRGDALSARLERATLRSVPNSYGIYLPPNAIRPSPMLIYAHQAADGTVHLRFSFTLGFFRRESMVAFWNRVLQALERWKQ